MVERRVIGYPPRIVDVMSSEKEKGVMKLGETTSRTERVWEPMRLEPVGHVADVMRGTSTTGQPDAGLGKKGASL